jgi:hypothetical protein
MKRDIFILGLLSAAAIFSTAYVVNGLAYAVQAALTQLFR